MIRAENNLTKKEVCPVCGKPVSRRGNYHENFTDLENCPNPNLFCEKDEPEDERVYDSSLDYC